MPVIMPKWIADNRIISKPVGAVSAPGAAAAGGGVAATVEQSDNKWYPGKAAEIKAMQARAAEANLQ
jgi:hypothetical protein